MLETFVALIFAHTLADFVFQTKGMVENKRRIPVLLAHVAIVLVLSALALGDLHIHVLAVIGISHLMMDAVKTHWLPSTWQMFLLDQVVHILVIFAVVLYWPDVFASGHWGHSDGLAMALPASLVAAVPSAMATISGLVIATRMGDFLIGLVLTDLDFTPRDATAQDALPSGGRLIGTLERAIIFVLAMTGNFAGVGFLIAAKSILRFSETRENRAISEYVIVGTLLSFGWAMIVALGTTSVLEGLRTP